MQLTDSKNFCCWPCKSGPLLFTATLPQTAYVPGQAIPITLDVVNNSNVRLEEVHFELKEKIGYLSEVPHPATKYEERQVARLKCEGCEQKGRKHNVISLTVPAVPPTNINLCRVIKITYELIIRPKTAIGSKDLKQLEIPIVIGTIPLSMPSILPASDVMEPTAPAIAPDDCHDGGFYLEMVAEHPELAFIRKSLSFLADRVENDLLTSLQPHQHTKRLVLTL